MTTNTVTEQTLYENMLKDILHDEDLNIFVLSLSHNTSYYFFGNDLRESQFICKKYSFSNIPHLNYEKISFQQFLDKTNNSFSIHNKNYKISFSIPYFAKIFNKIVYSGNQHLIQYILDNIHLFLLNNKLFDLLTASFTNESLLLILNSSLWKTKKHKFILQPHVLTVLLNRLCTTDLDFYPALCNFVLSNPTEFSKINHLIVLNKFIKNRFPQKFSHFLSITSQKHEDKPIITQTSNIIPLSIDKSLIYSLGNSDNSPPFFYWKNLKDTASYLLNFNELELINFYENHTDDSTHYFFFFFIKENSSMNFHLLSNIFLESFKLRLINNMNNQTVSSIINYFLLTSNGDSSSDSSEKSSKKVKI